MILLALSYKITITVALMILSYILGAMPFGLWIGKSITGIDVREHGSKNIGTTNCIRVLGKKVGFLVFFFDVLKGMLVTMLVRFIFDKQGLVVSHKYFPYVLYGLAAVLGHAFSIFLKGKGGKSVAASLGLLIAVCPLSAATCLVAFGIVFVTTGYVSLCSTAATIAAVATIWVLNYFGFDHGYILEQTGLPTCIIASCIGAFLLYKHKSNYKRLLNGTENCFKKKKNKEPKAEETKVDEK